MSHDRSNLNRQRVLAEIRSAGAVGRADLAKALNLSVQAVSNIADALLQKGPIKETGRREGGRGLPVVLYGLSPDGAYSLGYEIRPTALFLTVLDQTGVIRHQNRVPLSTAAPDPVLNIIASQTAELSGFMPRTIGAGIVRPGPFGTTDFPVTGNELPGWDIPDLLPRLQAATGLPVMLDNDATAGAAAEHQLACHTDEFAYLYFGTGLGLGIISNGAPLRGAFGNFGEIGSLRLQGLDGRLEHHLSRAALEQALAGQGAPLDMSAIGKLHAAGHPALTQWIAGAAGALALAVEAVENLFDPATIVLGGAMPAPVLQALIDQCPLPTGTIAARPNRALPRLQLGTCGPFTVSTGAAALVLNQYFQAPRLI